MENVAFTSADRIVLQSYIPIVDGLSAFLGNGNEIILYSLENMEKSIVKIANGHYTGRDVGGAINNLALSIADYYHTHSDQEYSFYVTNDKDGKPIRFISIAVRGANNRVIGLLCINSYMHTPQHEVLANFFDNPSTFTYMYGGAPAAVSAAPSQNPEEVLRETVMQVRQRVEQDPSVRPSVKNKEIVQELEAQGIFRLKNAVVQVAELLGISKNTVYLHLRNSSHQG